jgi:7-keto-8-aminopelargonate synthetase-like enzyme
MPTTKLSEVLANRLETLGRVNRLKGDESVICGVIPARDGKGSRYLLEGEGDKTFLRMNSNSYLGMSFRAGVVAAEDEAARAFGTGPGSPPADLLVATLGKAFGVNGGYVVAGHTIIRYLRETSPFYIYSNPITPAEAAAACAAVDTLDSPVGIALVENLRAMAGRFRTGLDTLGFETLPGEHPIVPLMLRDTARTTDLVARLRKHGILATGLNYPVVPKGDEEIRFQIGADHTMQDIDDALAVLRVLSSS